MMKLLGGFLLCGVVMAGLGARYAAAPSTVRTAYGAISGRTLADGVTTYLGIPFAAPPVGDLRWRPPQPPAAWTGVRAADHFGDACMEVERHSAPPYTEPFMEQGPLSEDCLYLNIWTPPGTAAASRSAPLPVMVFIYGGGFSEGAGSVAVYNGDQLARRGVIQVNFNYRVGALGFLAYPGLSAESPHHTSGNYGLLDQIAALQWVHRNIAAFGGDPRRVTIFGQSAGAASVYDLMQSPLARGLFARAIAESGPGLHGMAPYSASAVYKTALAGREQAGERYAESKGAHSLAELRALPAQELASGRGNPYRDGWVLPAAPPPPDSQVPLLVGMVANDIGIGAGFGHQPPTAAVYAAAAQKKYGDLAQQFLRLYPAASDSEVLPMQLVGDRDQERVSLDLFAAAQLRYSPRVYTYYFDRPTPWPEHPEFQTFHASELSYVFDNLALVDHPWQPVDRQIADRVSAYWLNFATTGNPNAAGLPPWPAYRSGPHTTMELGVKMGPMPETATPARLAFQLSYLRGGH